MKRTTCIICVLLILFSLSPVTVFAASKAAKTYDKAQDALIDGKYQKAADLFESVNGYEDAAQYALYAKALMYCSDGEYDDALKTLAFLGDFKDSIQLINYYAICKLSTSTEIDDILDAAEQFDTISMFRDSSKRAEECRQRIYNIATEHFKSKDYKTSISIFSLIENFKDSREQIENCYNAIKEEQYLEAVALQESGDYINAIAAFNRISGWYKDKEDRILKIQEKFYDQAEEFEAEGDYYNAATTYFKATGYKDAWERCFGLWGKITDRKTIAAAEWLTAGLREDGHIIVANGVYQREQIYDWENIVAISAGPQTILGLCFDGTVAIDSYYDYDVSGWNGIVAISVGSHHIVGLKADGSVVAAVKNSNGECDVSAWDNIVMISAGDGITVGLKKDGTVAKVGRPNVHEYDDITSWKNIIRVSAGGSFVVGIQKDGSVAYSGLTGPQFDLSGWNNIVDISAGEFLIAGLHDDGTAVLAGYLEDKAEEYDVSNWDNVIAVSTGQGECLHVVCLCTDGTVDTVTASSVSVLNDVRDWTNIKTRAE